jgi:cardiolipin synthase
VNLPNLLTIARILLVPVVVWLLMSGLYMAAFWLFVLAGVTDGVDGYLARRWNQRTLLGSYLDPLADKALLVSIYVTLGFVGELPRWLVIAVVFRDVLIVGAFMLSWIMGRPMQVAPLFVSKANTAAQIVFAAIVLGAKGYALELAGLEQAFGVVVAALTVISTAAYLAAWMRHMTRPEPVS